MSDAPNMQLHVNGSPVVMFFVHGTPKAQPRPRAFARKMGNGKFAARIYDAGTAENWKSLIADRASKLRHQAVIIGPVQVNLTFYMPRPKHHYRSGDPLKGLKPDAPTWHTAKPDRDNLEKAVLDTITQIGGFWLDDAQVCAGSVEKRYCDDGNDGVHVSIRAIPPPPPSPVGNRKPRKSGGAA